MMHLVLLGHMDPNDERFWSGIPMNIARSLREAGHRVTTLGPLEPDVTLWGRIKGRYYRHAWGTNYLINRDPTVCRARARQANRLLQDHRTVDAVIVVYPPDASYLRCPVPLILVHDSTWHQLLDFYPGYERSRIAPETVNGGYLLDRLALENCDRAIYSSRWAADSVSRDYGIDRSKVRVVTFGAGLASVPTRARLGELIEQRRHAPCRLLLVGVDWHRKGCDIAVEIARQLRNEGLPVELRIAGCDPPSALPSFVRSFGYLSKNDPAQSSLIQTLFEEATFFLLPTRADCLGMVLNEAAAYGLPVVTTGVGGVPEVLGDGQWALALSPATSPEEFARWIRTSYADGDAYERMAWSARRDFEERLNWGVFCRDLVAIIEAVQHEKQSPSDLNEAGLNSVHCFSLCWRRNTQSTSSSDARSSQW